MALCCGWRERHSHGHTPVVAKGGKFQRRLEKHAINPLMRSALRVGVAPRAFALLETTGRRSGQRRLTPVGNGLVGETFWLVSEHGVRCDYVRNLVANPSVRVKVGRRWRSGIATLVEEDDGLARRRHLDRANGVVGRMDGAIFRASVSNAVTVRIDLT